jgi:5-hydroxyisourate hydrolase-like protein (transthyretin family)
LFINFVYSSQSDFETNPKNCSYTWGNLCDNSTLNDAFSPCNGTQIGGTNWAYVKEVYINATNFFPGSGINVTCRFFEIFGTNNYEYLWYYNATHWINIWNWTVANGDGVVDRPVVFNLNSSEDTHIVRCIVSFNGATSNNCANSSTTSAGFYDNDDVNFTVTDHFKYDSWNLTNYTGTTILDGVNLTRNDLINASVHWNKNIFSAMIQHNGNGTFINYTVSFSGNWTNYTLNLSNTTEFSTPGLINVSYIWANDTFGLENYTSPTHYFYLWGNSKVSNITVNDSVIYNESGVQVSCKVEDNSTNSGISNYNISFYEDDRFLNTVSTNSSGWANYSYTVNASTIPTNLNLKCNITDSTNLFYNASSENSKNTSLSLTELGIQVFTSSSSLVYGNNVEITANTTGNASSITTIQANISFTNLTNGAYVQAFELKNLTLNQTFSSTDYKFNLTYHPPIPSNYSVNITVIAGKEKFNTTYFYVWGYSKLQEITLNASTIYNTTSARIECHVKDNSTGNPIQGYNVSFFKNDSSIGNSTTNSTGWANYTYTFNEASLPTNYIIKCNITDSASLYYNTTAQNSNSTILGVVNPYEVLLGNVDFKRGVSTTLNKTNLLDTSFTFYLSVSDTLQMDSVTLNLTYPENAINVNFNMTGNTSADWHEWNCPLSNASYSLNMTGTYTIGIIAKNSYGTQNISTNYKTFYVNGTYDINSSESSTYMRGENVTIKALGIYGTVDNVSWTVNVTKINETYNYSAQTTIFNYTVLPNDPVGNYTILVINATKDGNHGNLTFNFSVSNELNVSISTSLSSPTTLRTSITVDVFVYNARSTLHDSTFNANISCYNASFIYIMRPLSFSSSNASFICYSPTTYSTDYNITVNLTDAYNNTGIGIFNLTTESAPPSGGNQQGGGGGGGGGGGNITIIQNVTVNTTVKTTDFNFTAQTTGIQVYRGEDATILGSVSNSGNTNLTVSSSIFLNSTCCIVSIVPSEFKLNVGGSEVPFTISIHVNTSTEPEKEYFFDINLKSGTLEKTKRIKIIVKENPVISSLQQVSGQVSGIENELKEYARVGLNIGDLEGLLNKIKEMLSGSQSHIEKDDINTLKTNENSVKLSLAQINDQLNKLAFVKTIYENKWNIVSGITIGIISTYLVVLVFVPYFRLGLEITKLNFEKTSLIKSRVETEKNYFLRKIDEKTFRTIISGKQSQIYKITSDIKLKEQARPQLFRERINPMYLGKLIKEKIAKIRSKNKHVTPPPQQSS